ncbi:hypothetical protein V5799_017767 [Amblyomma americanum]|uniref:Uncharacterized protein n=1 Tax=Amblyomma americanum TaxID=6943 RepID=A0AAQ4F177_AMBAM
MWTSSGAPSYPVPQTSPGEDSRVLAVHGASEGDAVTAAGLTATSSTPVTSRYACSWATAFAVASDAAMTPPTVAIDGLTYHGSPTTAATHSFSAEDSGDRFLGGGFGVDAAATSMRSNRQCGNLIQPPPKSSASSVTVATVPRRKINNRAQFRHCFQKHDFKVAVLICCEAGRPEYESSSQPYRNASGSPSVSPFPPSPDTPADIADYLVERPLDSTTHSVRPMVLSIRAERLPYASGDNSLEGMLDSPDQQL